MSKHFGDGVKLTLLGWLATVATACCFLPAISNSSYLLQAALLCALLSATGLVLRAVRTPALVVALAQLLLTVEVLVLGFGDDLKYGLLPTERTLDGLGTDISAGLEVAQAYAAPTPEAAGLTLLVLLGIAAVGVFVELLAVGLHRVALTGLPLLTLYTVPVTALPDGVPIYGFLPGAVAFVALLLADERDRLTHWGRLVSRTGQGTDHSQMDTSGLVAAGRKISVIAVSAAVVIPIFVPAFSPQWFDRGTGMGNGPGDGSGASFNDPMVSLAQGLRRPEKVDVLEVSSTVSPQYLRLAVLDQPGPDSWNGSAVTFSSSRPLDDVLPLPTGLSEAATGTPRRITVDPTDAFPSDSRWLPVPFAAQTVDVGGDGDWVYVPRDQTVTATSDDSAESLEQYAVDYVELQPDEDQLRAAADTPVEVTRDFGQVPGGLPPVVQNQAELITSGARSHYEEAVLLQEYFRDSDRFIYDVDAGYGYGYEAMADFLDERRGFCQQFAATMAMMARTLGIPSRIVVGFLQPDRKVDSDSYVISSYDAHAWPELYFEGVGWVRFEPTPSVGAPIPDWAEPIDESSQLNPSGGNPTQTPLDPRINPNTLQNPATDPSADDDATVVGGGGAPPSRGWLVGVGALIVLLLPALIRVTVRRSRLHRPVDQAEAAEAAWRELRDHLRDLRMPWTGSMTPRARARSVAALLDGDQGGLQALHRLCQSVERSRFAASELPGADPTTDVVQVTASIDRAVDRASRLRAWLLPVSLLSGARRNWESWRDRRQVAETTGPA